MVKPARKTMPKREQATAQDARRLETGLNPEARARAVDEIPPQPTCFLHASSNARWAYHAAPVAELQPLKSGVTHHADASCICE